jgi:glycosyltransferase involved in cell wall biosynthesis
MLIVVLADTGWSIGLVHRGVEKYLPEHTFIFYNQGLSLMFEKFMIDIYRADIIMTTLNNYIYINSLCNTPELRKKIAIVCHGISEIKMIQEHHQFKGEFSTDFTYSVTSDVLVPFHPRKVYITPNGIDHTLFTPIKHSGKIENLGWAAASFIGFKRVDWSYKIADLTGLPLTIASRMPFDNLVKLYKTFDVLIVTSGPHESDETGPLPPFEAIASGILAIGTPVGNFSHVPGPKFNTIEEAVKIINELKNDPERVLSIIKEQYEFVMENYTYNKLALKWDIMFKDTYMNK